jgi:hypothetical protein
MSIPQPVALSAVQTVPGEPDFLALMAWPFAEQPFYEGQVKRLLQKDIPHRVLYGFCQVWVYRDPSGNIVGFGTLDLCRDYAQFTQGKYHAYIPLLAVNPGF